MDARSAKEYSKDDWAKLASEAESKVEGVDCLLMVNMSMLKMVERSM
ncbi:MAG: hypothetical protein Ct9H300mP6_01880 [Gammaproteobacteria bacterium]|nr:MAG: hypothetical protein Ct9H300mP6_01880 [Gammaproteobacteria bacterium]